MLPSREEQFDFFTNTYDDTGEDEEKIMSAMKANLKIQAERRRSRAASKSEQKVPVPTAGVLFMMIKTIEIHHISVVDKLKVSLSPPPGGREAVLANFHVLYRLTLIVTVSCAGQREMCHKENF